MNHDEMNGKNGINTKYINKYMNRLKIDMMKRYVSVVSKNHY